MKIIKLTGLLLLLGCSGMGILSERTFIRQMDGGEELWIAGRDFPLTSGDSGLAYRSHEQLMSRTPASKGQTRDYTLERSLAQELAWKEAALSMRERSTYESIKWELESVSEKIYYLNLSSRDRREYLATRFPSRVSKPLMTKKKTLRQQQYFLSSKGKTFGGPGYVGPEISLRMGKQEVIDRWGRPYRIDVAGNPSQENERWIFYRGGGKKTVYFERGRVQGWDLPH